MVRKVYIYILMALAGTAELLPLPAAEFLFTWKASPDTAVVGYAIYQRTGDAPYERIDAVAKDQLQRPDAPGYWVTGLADGNTYHFAAAPIFASGGESDLQHQTCITVNGEIVECTDDDQDGTTVFISCFIGAAECSAPNTSAKAK